MHTDVLLPREARYHRAHHRRTIARDEDRVIARIERRELDPISLDRSDTLHHVALIRKTCDNHIVNSWSPIELEQNYVARLQHRCHTVTGYAKRDVFARWNVIRKVEPAIARLVPNLSTLSRRDGQIEHRDTSLATRRSE